MVYSVPVVAKRVGSYICSIACPIRKQPKSLGVHLSCMSNTNKSCMKSLPSVTCRRSLVKPCHQGLLGLIAQECNN